jgi:hypothetical protein
MRLTSAAVCTEDIIVSMLNKLSQILGELFRTSLTQHQPKICVAKIPPGPLFLAKAYLELDGMVEGLAR